MEELIVSNQNNARLMKTEEQSTEFGLKKKLVVHYTIKLRVYYLSFLSSNLTSLKIWKKSAIFSKKVFA